MAEAVAVTKYGQDSFSSSVPSMVPQVTRHAPKISPDVLVITALL